MSGDLTRASMGLLIAMVLNDVCRENHLQVNGVELCWFEWGEHKKNEQTIVLVHATGFHARCWDQTIKYLGDNHIVALDMRGHGRSGKMEPYNGASFGGDVTAFIDLLDLNNIVGVGHSMGGLAMTHAAANLPDRFSRVVLVDPVIMNPELYALVETHHDQFLNGSGQHPIARRRNFFIDAESMFENFEGRGSYGSWKVEALHDYCEYGLLPDPDGGGYVLACPPRVEASIYMGSSSLDIFDKISRIKIPVTVLRARQRSAEQKEMDFSQSPTWDQLASKFHDGRDVSLPELTHFMPMQAPELVAEYILGTK